jgi:hypothetical protein
MRHPRRALLAAILVALSASSVAAAVFAVPASATPPATLTTTYTESEVPTSIRTAGGNTFVTFAETATFTGDMTGDATGTERFLFRRDGSFVLHLTGTCLCSVASNSGTLTFRVQGGGTFDNASGTVVGTGSDGLEGLHLNGTWSLVAPGVVAITATYHFDG